MEKSIYSLNGDGVLCLHLPSLGINNDVIDGVIECPLGLLLFLYSDRDEIF